MFRHPTLLIDETTCRSNIAAMTKKAVQQGVNFRPHFKTHQSAEIGEWFRESGVTKIAVSSVKMAEYFAHNGWNDILIAFPVNTREIEQIKKLSQKIKLFLTIESLWSVEFLLSNIQSDVGIYLEIDEGYHRTGISYKNKNTIGEILESINKSEFLHTGGFLAHFGQTYSAGNREEIIKIYNGSLDKLLDLKLTFANQYPGLKISIVDTPSCSVLDEFSGVDEIRPGNFAFYDVMQYFIGSCSINDIAVALACPVVAVYPERNEMAVYGGAVHLSKDYCMDNSGEMVFGLVVPLTSEGWGEPFPETFVARLSQEHGIIKTTPEVLGRITPGDVVGVLPVHSCLTANLAEYYFTPVGRKIGKMRS